MKTHKTFSASETKKLGAKIAKEILSASPQKTATALFLKGVLGSCKTTLVQGILRSLGVKGRITSPTFVLMKHYKARGRDIYHLDAYRLKSARDLVVLDFAKKLKNPKAIILVEWPERIRGSGVKKTIRLSFAHGRTINERKISVHSHS